MKVCRRAIFSCLLALSLIVFRTTPASSLSYVALTPLEVTEHTDVWIRARVVSVYGRETFTNDFGSTVRDITVQLEVLETTDDTLPKLLTIRSETSFHARLTQGSQVFAAFKVDGFTYLPLGNQLGLYGWDVIDSESDTIETAYGGVSTADYWQWLRDVRVAIDSERVVSDEAVSRWIQALEHGDIGLVGLAGDYLQLPRKIPLNASAFIAAFERVYDKAFADAHEYNAEYYETRRNLCALASSVAVSLQRYDPNDAGRGIINFITADAKALKLMDEPQAIEALLGVLQRLTEPQHLAQIPQLYDIAIRPDNRSFRLLPTAPSDEIDAWLRQILYDPATHGIKDSLTLACVWRAMANRGDQEAIGYLRDVVDGAREPPTLEGDYFSSEAKSFAQGVLETYERETLSHDDKLSRWVRRAAQGESKLLLRISQEIAPEDRIYIPALTALRGDQWLGPYSPPYFPLVRIAKTIPDPGFVPVLLEFAHDWPDGAVFTALAVCGEETLAEEMAVAALKSDLPQQGRREISQAVSRKAGLVLFLGSREDPALASNFMPYLDRETLSRIGQLLTRVSNDRQGLPYQAWDLRDAALLALAKSGHSQATPRLTRALEVEDIRGRFVAAMALYALGNDAGIGLVEAYRLRKEREIPELEARWSLDFAGGNVFRSVITYLETPSLDQLYLDRTKLGFNNEDRDLAMDPGLLARRGPEVMAMLISHIDNRPGLVVSCLKRITGEDFGYQDADASPIQRELAINRWKEYLEARN